jgi:NAD+ synthase
VNSLDIHAPLVEQLLVQFLREEVASAGFSKAVLGISGGVDSALVAALCAKAFGPQNVLGVMMPYKTSHADSEGHARLLAQRLGIVTKKVEITAMADGYLASNDVKERLRRGNVMARARMIVLYDQSVDFKGLVIGTSNKTEILLGYSTQWGDSASAVNPIGDLYKAQIYQLSRHMGVPGEILDKAPSADLFEGQTDEGELGFTYADADKLLYLMVDERLSEAELAARGFDLAFVRKMAGRIASTQFKRVMPIIAKLSHRTINQDFRYLRDWGK